MPPVENIWSLGLFAALGLALWAFTRIRRRTVDFHQSAIFKSRLPPWVAQFEALTFCALIVAWVVGVAFLFFRVLVPLVNAHVAKTGASAIYVATGVVMIAVPAGLICANFVSWLIPPARRANLQAMKGLDLSFWSLTRGLVLFGAVSVPIGLVLLALCIIAPWRM